MYGVYNTMPVAGHFYAEVEFDDDNDVGLALIQEKDGVPDINNFTMIFVDTNSAGKVLVKLHDRQDGVDDVLDNTNSLGEERYEHTLDGSRYSLPFVGTNKKLRILRDGPAGFFHLYYGVKAYIHGDWAEGWIELAPSRDWADTGTKYYVALVAGSGSSSAEVRFDNVRAIQKPRGDRDDSVTGFEAFRGEYNWSGFFGDAVVITFGDDFAYRGSDRKFVFWSEANYIPGWHMNNQLLYSYEFLETWGGDVVGCHEPMSDRMRRWSSVDLLEDNDVRKVVRWHYVLCNPDYQVPRDWQGMELPEGDEYWTFYPDGTGLRHIVYTPKLDTSFRNGHELMELIPIAGSLTDPAEHMVHPALTVMNLDGDVNTYHLDPLTTGPYNEQTSNWDQVIAAAHFMDGPDAFCVFSHSSDVPETYSYYNIEFDISWHNTGRFRLVHWPVGLEPYIESDGIKTHATWTAEVAHACLMGGGVYNEGQDWTDHYQVDSRGREYREWVSLVGLSEPGNLEELRDRTETWLYPGTVTMLNPSSIFEGVNYKQRELVFNNTGGNQICEFSLLPGSTNVVNPSFKIKGWGDNPVSVSVNGIALTVGLDFRRAIEGSDALVWVKGKFDSPTTFSISDLPKSARRF
jgi:hypothetical protein